MVPSRSRTRRAWRSSTGDELVFPIFYRDEDAAEAKAQDEQ